MNIRELPIGIYADYEPVYINLESRNVLIAGNPRSGKSVCLSALICSLLRCSNEKIIICSPKILDFQKFKGVCHLYKEADEILKVLESLSRHCEWRKEYCEKRGLKKITEFTEKLPHITIILDEYTVLRKKTTTDEKGKVVKIGEQIESLVHRSIAEYGFAGVSFVISLQRASSTNFDTNIRDILSGVRISFATSGSVENTKMVFGDWSEFAPCHLITREQVGCGFISVDDTKPRAFKGAFATDTDELLSVQEYWNRKENNNYLKTVNGCWMKQIGV